MNIKYSVKEEVLLKTGQALTESKKEFLKSRFIIKITEKGEAIT